MERLFLSFSADKLRQSESRILQCLDRLSAEQLWWRGSEESNSVANLVLHLCGNVRQWIIASLGGQPDQRERDGEFAAREGLESPELQGRLKQTLDEATTIIRGLDPERLGDAVRIQGHDTTVLEAIYHVVEHFSLHTGQIIYATKLLRKEDLGFYRYLSDPSHKQKTP